jgi:ribosomal protein L7/L12
MEFVNMHRLNVIRRPCNECNGTGVEKEPINNLTVVKLAIMMTDSGQRKIEAIKYLRNHHTVGLKEAKDYIEQVIMPLVEYVEDALGDVK